MAAQEEQVLVEKILPQQIAAIFRRIPFPVGLDRRAVANPLVDRVVDPILGLNRPFSLTRSPEASVRTSVTLPVVISTVNAVWLAAR